MKPTRLVEVLLSQRERDLADFVENGVVPLHWVAEDGTILWVNQAELDLLGYTREEYVGRHVAEFHADQHTIDDILRRLSAGEKLHNYEAQLRRKDGSIRQVLISSSVRFEDEQFIHTRCFTIDITERKQAEEHNALLYELMSSLAEALTLQQVATIIVEQGVIKAGARAGLVALLNKEQTHLETVAIFGYAPQIAEMVQRIALDSPIALTDSVRRQQPIWLRNPQDLQARFPMVHPLNVAEDKAWAAIPLIVEKRPIGAIRLSFATPQPFEKKDRDFIYTLTQQSAQALHRARLAEEAQNLAVLEERHRLARDLHDAVSQTLFSATTIAQAIPALWERNREKAFAQLEQTVHLNQAAMAEMRALLLELRPDTILKTPLEGLLEQLLKAARGRRTLAVDFVVEGEPVSVDPDVHLAVYRIAQESIHNVLKHSGATTLALLWRTSPEGIFLRIDDNGNGFDRQQVSAGMGLGNMRHRAEQVGATLEITSTPGQGTQITLRWTRPRE